MELTIKQQVFKLVIAKAWKDKAFKQALIKNPIKTISQLTGEQITLPDGQILQVVDQSNPNVLSLNIPHQPILADMELTDNELELVAGGFYPISIIDVPGNIGLKPSNQPKLGSRLGIVETKTASVGKKWSIF